ncbi:glycoside hydrolase family 19 protein [Cupriavidus metallidurans]|jgi:predicted chitinase|uniref:glycoside hydrolase family 19 protein n=1 Tax=Cupriavidus metallidurans TaxID=119219 RepID=UPI000763B6DE|nr:hypothetical protein [Cupriavidus metallidurans]KWW36266.1 hypothetical protein AU374_02319 [Cupriavidus metallidurans]
MATTPATPSLPPLKPLRFTFPFRKKGNGTASVEITDEHEFHRILKNEPSGTYSLSSKGMWHGGIHISEAGAGQALDLKGGVRCIADGDVVAWRLNRSYPISELPAQNGKPAFSAPYSTGFALVRHAMEFPRGTKLTFFSLYMHLQDLAGYESDATLPKPAYWTPEFKVTEYAQDKPHVSPRGVTAPSEQKGLRVRATHPHGAPRCILPLGTQFSISERAGDWGKIKDIHGTQPYPPTVGAHVAPSAAVGGWAFLGKEHGGYVANAVMPDSMLDQVVVPPQPVPIKAGDLIGYLGRYDSLGQQISNQMVHIEVFCGDAIKPFLQEGRAWIEQHSPFPDRWKQLGLPSEPTILRIARQTKLYKAALNEGQDAPQTGVIQVLSLAGLARLKDNKVMETTPGTDNQKRPWWKVDSADVRSQVVSGWVREQSFAGGRVTREFAQAWIDFDASFDDPHDPTHTMFATTKAYVDYSLGADVPAPGALAKLSPLMAKVYRAIYATGDGRQAADELCDAANDPWRALRMSRLIIKHESEWANPVKWRHLIQEIETRTGPQVQHEAEQKRIEKLVWWDEVKAGVSDLPGSDVFHIHPIGMVGNFARENCKALEITTDMLKQVARATSDELLDEYVSPLNRAFVDHRFDSCISQGHFLAQILHESGEFKFTKELGGAKTYDPWRGRGLMQITFEKNYKEYQAYSGVDCTSNQMAMAELEKSNHALLSAAWFYIVKAGLRDPSNADDFIWITRVINGGFNGYDDRLKYFNRAVQSLNLQGCLKLNRDGKYRFEESRAYNEKRASCAWGIWNDSGLGKGGIARKSNDEAKKGYKRYLELDLAAGSPVDVAGQPKDKNWYGISGSVKTYVQNRLAALEASS